MYFTFYTSATLVLTRFPSSISTTLVLTHSPFYTSATLVSLHLLFSKSNMRSFPVKSFFCYSFHQDHYEIWFYEVRCHIFRYLIEILVWANLITWTDYFASFLYLGPCYLHIQQSRMIPWGEISITGTTHLNWWDCHLLSNILHTLLQ